MSKLGKRLIRSAREGVAIARGELDPASYRVRNPLDREIERAIGTRRPRKAATTSKAAKKAKRA